MRLIDDSRYPLLESNSERLSDVEKNKSQNLSGIITHLRNMRMPVLICNLEFKYEYSNVTEAETLVH